MTRSIVLAALFGFCLAGCFSRGHGRSDGHEDGALGRESYDPPSSNDGTGQTAHSTNDWCGDSADCPYWFCECEDDAIVNGRTCHNQYCLDDAGACPPACRDLGHGDWVGTLGSSDSATDDEQTAGADGEVSCGGATADTDCELCAASHCCPELLACADADCIEYSDCSADCDDQSCREDCEYFYPSGADAVTDLLECTATYCASDC